MFIIDIFVSFICAFLASLGVGGGGILVIYLTLLRSLPQKTAQGANLFFFTLTMAVTFLFHKFKGRILIKNIHWFLLSSILGGGIGCTMSKFIDNSVLKLLFSIFMIICGAISLFKSTFKAKK